MEYQIAQADNALIFVGLRPGITVARAARAGGLAQAEPHNPVKQVAQVMWVPAYPVVAAA